jgi:hypothetical protein
MSQCRQFLATAAALLLAGGQVFAQAAPPWHLKGSDTLFDIVTQSILNAQAAGVPGANNLVYDGTGSGNGENQMKVTKCETGQTGPCLGVQSIAPMSRNFRPATIDAAAVGGAAHASWYPGVQNVVGLDAAVLVTKGSGTGAGCKNLNIATFVDSAATGTPPVTRGNVNQSSLPTVFGDSGAFNQLSGWTENYSNLLMIVLGGVDGKGTLESCSDARRVQALQDLAACLGVDHIEHLYRRDDNSGTTDTWKDRIIVTNSATGSDPRYPFTGGRFCNGQSIGGINGSTTQTGICSVTRTINTCKLNSDCPATETCLFNLNNQDLDPVRRSCVASDASHAPTTCTDMTTGLACQASDGNPNCTQGFVVALSDVDPGPATVTDITTSIAARVKNDSLGQSIGYAGKEAAAPGRGTKGLLLNTVGFSISNVRKEAYLLARRLFLQNGLVSGQPAGDVPNDLGTGISVSGGGTTEVTAEQNLFAYMTDPNGSQSAGVPGRCNTDPVVRQFGFYSCLDDCTADVSTASNNLCNKTPAPAINAPLGAIWPNVSAGTAGTCSVTTTTSCFANGDCPTGQTCNITGSGTGGTRYISSSGAVSCTTGSGACDSTGGSCGGANFDGSAGTPGFCPKANGRPLNSACTQGSDCASSHCTDGLGIGITGQPVSLICTP